MIPLCDQVVGHNSSGIESHSDQQVWIDEIIEAFVGLTDASYKLSIAISSDRENVALAYEVWRSFLWCEIYDFYMAGRIEHAVRYGPDAHCTEPEFARLGLWRQSVLGSIDK
mgnify:CR=1 FL=1